MHDPDEHSSGTSALRSVLASLRPRRWPDNLLVLAPLLFSGKLWDYNLCLRAVAAVAVFWALSGAAYILDDIADMEQDRRHPIKAKRPIPAGRLRLRWALIAFLVLLSGGLIAADYLSLHLFVIALAYLVLLFCYAFVLNRIEVIDLCGVAGAYVLRVAGGWAVLGITPPGWLLVCAGALGLLVGAGRRAQGGSRQGAAVVYDAHALDHMMAVAAAVVLSTYAVFSLSHQGSPGAERLYYTAAFVAYGVLRYLHIAHGGPTGRRKVEPLSGADWPLTVCTVLWAGSVALIVHG